MVENHKTVYVWCTASQGQIPRSFLQVVLVSLNWLPGCSLFYTKSHKDTKGLLRRLVSFELCLIHPPTNQVNPSNIIQSSMK